MPKLPTIVGPQVAPAPVNLPGARRVFAGEGATALGGAVTQAAGAVEQVMDARQKAEQRRADMREVDRRVNDGVDASIIRWEVDPKEQYRKFSAPTKDGGTTRGGVTTTYLNKFREVESKFADGLSQEQREIYDLKVRQRREAFESRLLKFEGAALDDEAVGTNISTVNRASEKAGAVALNLLPEDVLDPALRGVKIAELQAGVSSPETMSAIEDILAVKPMSKDAADEMRAGFVAGYHTLVAQRLLDNNNIGKTVAEEYLKSALAKNPELVRNQRFMATFREATSQRQGERIAEIAASELKTAGGDPLLAARVLRAKVLAAGSSPEIKELGALAADRIQGMYDKAKANLLAEEEGVRGEFYRRIVEGNTGAASTITSLDQLSVRVKDPATGAVKVVKATELSDASQKVLLDKLRAPRRPRESSSGAPRSITSPRGRSLWEWFGTLNEEQMQKYASPDSDIYEGVPKKEVSQFVNMVSNASKELGDDDSRMMNDVQRLVEQAVLAKDPGNPDNATSATLMRNRVVLEWGALPKGRKRTDADAMRVMRKVLAAWDQPGRDRSVDELLSGAGIDIGTGRIGVADRAFAGVRPPTSAKVYLDPAQNKWIVIEDTEHEKLLRAAHKQNYGALPITIVDPGGL